MLKDILKPAEVALLQKIMLDDPLPVLLLEKEEHHTLVGLFARGLVVLDKATLHIDWKHVPRPKKVT